MSSSQLRANLVPKRSKMKDVERRQIRRIRDAYGPNQENIIAKFKQLSGRTITQGQCSLICSSMYEYLDFDTRKDRYLSTTRKGNPDYPALEQVLFDWQQRIQKLRAPITGDILKAKAQEFWDLLPQYAGMEPPKFSNGWLGGFKKRNNIKEYIYHGESADAKNDQPEALLHMQHCRDLCKLYEPRNIFNMDETGLWWKMIPTRTLATEQLHGGKVHKDRITVAFTCNADGTEKLEPIIIGKSENPRCFKHINKRRLGAQYYYNSTKWMTTWIMTEYLLWLNRKMALADRKILLFMDNFSAHESAVQQLEGQLSHIQIAFLPKNTTSKWQPLDQGIISHFKVLYRRFWVRYIIARLEEDKIPNKTINLLIVIRWIIKAWDEVKSSTIQACWYKSTLIKKYTEDDDAEGEVDYEYLATQKEEQRIINEMEMELIRREEYRGDLISMNEFINPSGEEIEDQEGDITEALIATYSIYDNEVESDIEEEDPPVRIKYAEALVALENLDLFEMQGDDEGDLLKKHLKRVRQYILNRKLNAATQRSIQSFFSS